MKLDYQKNKNLEIWLRQRRNLMSYNYLKIGLKYKKIDTKRNQRAINKREN